ncbi:hypothetical protein [Agromyces aerolatus]|uniref:hypothetical protein n=1 Tax=Agromyces sp. LY-1074 TaxID=3074080 RepID=UPI002858C0B6|nr:MULTISPECIES: hypothetical protein [unclassified Agromyces]MDR5700382.1 hypothetical protein [Agromyces sp. LY-1074]MDR5706640.1 hypothetical protein [Agromyces sp. LY-1358]
MSSERARTRSDAIVPFVLTAGLAAGVVAIGAGWSPALLAVSAIAALTFAFAQRFSWALGLAGALLTLLGLHTLISRLAPMLGVDFGAATTAGVALAGVGGVVTVVVTLVRGELRSPARDSIPTLLAALGLPAITLGYWLAALRWGSEMRVGWMLANDAVWNTMAAQFIVADGGIDPAAHPNPAPSTAALAAVWMLPGRDTAEQVLRHDVTREAQLVLLVTLAVAVLAGLVAARAVPTRHAVLRAVAGTAASGFVLGWYVLGFTAELGFLNAPIALLVLLAAWVCWSDVVRSPMFSGAGLLVAATLLLATWAPLVVVPLALGVAGLAAARRALIPRRGSWALVGVAAAAFVVYVVFVTLADLRSTGGALAADGAAPPVEPRDVTALAGVVLATTLLILLRTPPPGLRHQAIGALVVLVAAAFGGGYLVLQRLGQGLGWWGYYPAKFAWLVCVLLFVVLGGMLMAAAARATSARRVALGAVAAVAVIAVVASGSLPMGGVRRVPAAVAIATDDRFDASAVVAERLFVLADAEPTIAARISADRTEDAFLNSWLLQAHSQHSDDPIRTFAYWLDTDDAASLCEAIVTWGGGVRIVTVDPALNDELGAACPDAGFEVVVSP